MPGLSLPLPIGTLAKAAADSYEAPPTWIGAQPGLLMAAVLGSVRALRTKIDGITVIAIPGTDDVRVMLLDFLISKVSVVGHPELGRVHRGFALAAQALATVIELEPDEPYVLTGHSFGGAVAQPLALLLPRPPLGILGLAPARPFADEVPAMVKDLTHAYRYGNDPVPEEPGWHVSVACSPIGVSSPQPLDCHHAVNYVTALRGQ